MAGNAVIGALRVVIGADSAALEKGLKGAESSLDKFAAGVGKAMAVVGVAMAAAATALGISVKGMIDEADKLGKMAQSVGIPVEELSRLKHAADLSGIGMEELSKSVGKLSKSMSLIAGGKENDVKQAFDAIGISVKNVDGTLKTSTQVMTEIAGKFEKMEDGAGKTALAMAIFGKSGAAMIPLLNSGAQGLRDMMKEADELGIVIDSKTAKSAEAFNDNLTRLGKIKDGIILQVTARMLPAFENLSKVFLEGAKSSSLLQTTADVLTLSMKSLSTAAIFVGAIFKTILDIVGPLATALAQIVTLQFAKAAATLEKGGVDVRDTMRATIESISTIWNTTADKIAAEAPAISDKIAAPIIMAKAKANDTAWFNKILTDWDSVTNMMQTPAQKHAELIEKITKVYNAGLLSTEEWKEAQFRAAQQSAATWDQAGSSMAGSFSQIASSFSKESKSMAMAAKVFGAISATISMFTGAAKALELPFPANLAAMAAVLAKGAALVASIKSQSIPSFATGGSFVVPGGASNFDNTFVPLNLASGERVDITPANDVSGGSGTMVVHGLDPRQFFRGDTIRDMVAGIEEWVNDGGVVKLARA